jgi:hypothetical protein
MGERVSPKDAFSGQKQKPSDLNPTAMAFSLSGAIVHHPKITVIIHRTPLSEGAVCQISARRMNREGQELALILEEQEAFHALTYLFKASAISR